MCLRLGTKPPSELITPNPWNLLYLIPIRMGSSARVTGSAMWSQQNWVCSLTSTCLVYAALPGPRCQHQIKNPYDALGEKKNNYILQQQSSHTNNPYLPLHLLLIQPEFRLDFSMRSVGKLIIQSFVFHVFLQCCVFCLYIRCALRQHPQQTSCSCVSFQHPA